MTGKLPQSFIQEVLSRADIVDVIQSRVQLKKKGHNYQANCPFHQEKTPSFSVSQPKQFYYCFGCGAHGDVIEFLMTYDKYTFREAITYLANQVGLEIPLQLEQSSEHNSAPLYDILDQCGQYYARELRASSSAITYLKERGLSGHTAKTFAIGYAKEGWDHLLQHFKSANRKILLDAGMLIQDQKNTQRHYDRFRQRIMFPIRNIRGRVIGFGGRALGKDQQPKYLNSPETHVFLKHKELYGLYEAKQHTQLDQLLVVEGYMDVVSLHQHGIPYAVATLGTAIHLNHIQKLLSVSKHITFCFDGDRAGLNAAWKAIITTLPLLNDGIIVKILFLPDQEDPDSFILKHGKSTFEEMITAADELPTVFFNQLQKDHPIDSLSGKASYAQQAIKHIKTMPEGLLRNLMHTQLSERLQISTAQIKQLLQEPLKNDPVAAPAPPRDQAKPYTLPAQLSAHEIALTILLQHPLKAQAAHQLPTDIALNQEAQILNTLITAIEQLKITSMAQLMRCLPSSLELHREKLTILANYPLQISEDEITSELQGALDRIKEQCNRALTTQLIAKAKHKKLSDTEQKQLQKLLIEK